MLWSNIYEIYYSDLKGKISLWNGCINNNMYLYPLYQALRYLGITPNEEQKQAIRNRLHVDHSGTVPYGGKEYAYRPLRARTVYVHSDLP